MSYTVDYAEALDGDLEQLGLADSQGAALWIELIDTIYELEGVRNELLVNKGYHFVQPRFDTIPIGVLLKLGYNISRVKLYRADGTFHRHRLLYALNHSAGACTIWLLGLMERGANYDLNHPLLQRVCLDYDNLGIARVPRT